MTTSRGNPQQYYRNRQAATAGGHRRGMSWTEDEMKIVEDESYTAQEAALLLGRTAASVHAKRRNRRGGGLGRAPGQAPAEPEED